MGFEAQSKCTNGSHIQVSIFQSWKSSSKLLNKLYYLLLIWQIYFILTQKKAKFKLYSCIPRSPRLQNAGTEQGPLACYPHSFSSCFQLSPASPGALQPIVDTLACTSELHRHVPYPHHNVSPWYILQCVPLLERQTQEDTHIIPRSELGPFRQTILGPGI